MAGPVDNSSTTKNPYLEYLEADFETQGKDLAETVDEMDTGYTRKKYLTPKKKIE